MDLLGLDHLTLYSNYYLFYTHWENQNRNYNKTSGIEPEGIRAHLYYLETCRWQQECEQSPDHAAEL